MKKLALLIIPVLLLTATLVSGRAPELQSYCDLPSPQSMRVFDWATWRTAIVDDQSVTAAPILWDASRSIWRGYNSSNPFDQPSDTFKHWTVTATQENGQEHWIYILDSAQTPDTMYIYAFDNIEPFADNNGNHYGYHPCRAFAADATLVHDWLQQVYSPA